MIVALEGGDTNISLSSLDKLAEAMGADFVAMIAGPDASSKRIQAVAWRGEDATSNGVLLGSVPAFHEAQLWSWSLAPGDWYKAEPDPGGWHEMIVVIEGLLRLDKHDGAVTIDAGDFAIYSSAQSYAYCNAGSKVVRFIRTVVS